MALKDRLSLLKDLWNEFQQDNGTLLAAAMSFYDFLAFIPLLLAAVGIIGFVLGSPENAREVLSGTVSHFVVGGQAQDILNGVIRGRSAATGIGLLLLMWSGSSAIVVLENAINVAWETQQRGFLATRLLALGALAVTGALLLLSFGATTALHALRASSPTALADFGLGWTLLGYIVPIFLSIAPFVLIYKVLPNTRVSWGTALLTGAFTGILWEAAKHGFAYYNSHFASYNKVYGSFGSIILLLVWIYYSNIITILGAEFGALLSKRRQI